MKLQEKLDQIKAGFASQAPAEALEVMARTTGELIASGIHEKAVGVGSPFPAFDLADADGNAVRSSELIGDGPVIISFFRGFW